MDIQFKSISGGFFGHYRKEEILRHAQLHYHDSYELYYCLEGTRNYFTQSKIYPLTKNWVTLTKPYVIHGTNGEKYERLLISFSEDFLNTYFQPSLVKIFREVFSVEAIPAVLIEKEPKIRELFYSVVKEAQANNFKMAALYLGSLLLLLSERVKETPTVIESPTLPLQMQEILEYVSNNTDRIKSLEQVANHFYVSKYYLSHKFKNCTGFTFIEFLTKMRISRALHLLEHTNDTIASISETCGFETPTYFGVVFRKKMHMTPLQYRAWIAEKKSSHLPTQQKQKNSTPKE